MENLNHSALPYGASMLAGRVATVSTVRVRHANKQHGWYNRVLVRFHDTNETHSMGAAEFVKWSTKLEREAARVQS